MENGTKRRQLRAGAKTINEERGRIDRGWVGGERREEKGEGEEGASAGRTAEREEIVCVCVCGVECERA